MNKISPKIIQICKDLRKNGLSHRDIAEKIDLGLGTVYIHTKDVILTKEQHLFLKRRNIHSFTDKQRELGGINCPNKFNTKYSEKDLINFIKLFVKEKGRIPTKKEVQSHKPYVRIFDSWNNAIKAAGFEPNPVKYSKRRIAEDGHKCDSFSEMIIDDWLSNHGVAHEIHVRYPDSNMSADFIIKDDIRIEFLGLEGQNKKYDRLLTRKRELIKQNCYKVIEIKPIDLFPVNKLDEIFETYFI